MLSVDIINKKFDIDTNEILVVIQNKNTKEKIVVTQSNLYEKVKNGIVTINKDKYSKLTDLTGKQIGEWRVIEYIGDKKWRCQCSCGVVKDIFSGSLINNKSKSCGHNTTALKDLTGKHFGELNVIKYIGNKKWECQCSCGKTHIASSWLLTSGQVKSCGHNTTVFKDLTGKRFGEWEVLEYRGNEKWLCQCSCGSIKEVDGRSLRGGTSKSCGHNSTAFKDLSGQNFGELTVVKYVGNRCWLCKCSCGKTVTVHGYSLRNGVTRSCGHAIGQHINDTKITKYNETCPSKNRSTEQYSVLISKEAFESYLKTFNSKPSIEELSYTLNTGYTTIIQKIHKYSLEELVALNSSISEKEKEIYEFIKSIYDGEIIQSDRKTIAPQELDIYIPEKKLAIEFNGDYWHSSIYKDKYYHQQKTKMCIEKGIQLIHIFEYETYDNKIDKIKKLIEYKISDNKKLLYARKLDIREVDKHEQEEFLNKYHIQGYTHASFAYGLYNKDELISIITFGKSRFNEDEVEIIRLCTKDNIAVVGGTEKLIKRVKQQYTRIISYCDISKFSGDTYIKNGFKLDKYTEPNYVWVDTNKKVVLPRYQTQKNKLVKMGIGSISETENEIMQRLGYIKIYNSGNAKYILEG